MLCPNCGRQADDSAAFCPGCGSDLNAARAASQTEYQDQMAQYERDMAAYQSQYGTASSAPSATTGPTSGVVPAAGAKKSRAGLIVGIIVGILVLCSCVSCGLWFTAAPVISGIVGQGAWKATTGSSDSNDAQPSGESTAATHGPTTPEATIDAFYLAISDGELSTVKSLSTPAFGDTIDPGMFEGRDPNTNYRIASTTVKDDQATVDVAESSGDAPAQTTMTFTLDRQPDGTWLVAGFQATVLDDSTKTTPAPSPVAPRTVSKAQAIDVVGRYLNAQKSGHNAEMKTYVTKRFIDADPGRFVGSAEEAFIQFEVVKAVQKGTTWLVTTKESWISGPETPTYYVVPQNGRALINNQTWPQ